MQARYCIEYLVKVGLNPSDWQWRVTIVAYPNSIEEAADKIRNDTPDLDLETAMRITPIDDDLGGLYLSQPSDDLGYVWREVEVDDDESYYLV